MRRHGNMAFAVVFFVIGILMFVFTKDFAYNGLMNFGAGFWPRVIAVIMMVCAVLLFITSLFSKDPKMNEVVIDWKSAGMKRVYKVCGVMILFCVLLYLFGLCIALAFMICGIMLAMHEKRWWMLATFSVGMPIFIFVVFQVLLRVKLPMGIIFS